jgi:type VI secretion system lysozyme-like protein
MITGPRLMPGVAAPLFDRLVDTGDAADGLSMLDRDGLILSIAGEISQLPNTRCPRPRDAMAGRSRTTLDYGIPDLSGFQPFDSAAEAALVAELELAIATFEPRLITPRVHLSRLTPVLKDAFLMEWSQRAASLPPNQGLRLRARGFPSGPPNMNAARCWCRSAGPSEWKTGLNRSASPS